jgi:hypothetical protein
MEWRIDLHPAVDLGKRNRAAASEVVEIGITGIRDSAWRRRPAEVFSSLIRTNRTGACGLSITTKLI